MSGDISKSVGHVWNYERRAGKVAKDRRIEIWKEQGIEILQLRKGLSRARGYE
jgi:hypothetical protein